MSSSWRAQRLIVMSCLASCLAIAPLCAAPHAITAVSPSISDIQGAAAQLTDGGTVYVPAGRAEAVGTLLLPGGVNVVGAGKDKTVLYRPESEPVDYAPIIMAVDGANGKATCIRGLSVLGVTDARSKSPDTCLRLEAVRDFRVTDCHFERFGNAAIVVKGRCSGVVDNCAFVDNFKQPLGYLGYGVGVYGDEAWEEKVRPGTADTVFIEDCQFTGSRYAVAANSGATYVFRHNRVYGPMYDAPVDSHCAGHNNKTGTRWVEVYDNTIESDEPLNLPAMLLRGGGGVVFGNTMRNYAAGVVLAVQFGPDADPNDPLLTEQRPRDLWCWDNTLDGKASPPQVATKNAESLALGKDYFTSPMPDYKPFTYPHPLRNSRHRTNFAAISLASASMGMSHRP